MVMYMTYNVIVDSDADIMHFTKLSSKSSTQYLRVLNNMVLGCNMVHAKYGMRTCFIDRLPETFNHSMRSYWGSKESGTVHDPEG